MPGLGEISPINLQFERENFNALIGRHSQPIRWLESAKCPCIGDNQKVDENCSFCSGKGVNYSTQTESIRVEKVKAPIDGIIELPNVISVRDFSGNNYPITSSECVTYATGVLKGRDYQVRYTEDVTQSGTGTAEYIDDKLYKIDLPTLVDFGTVQGTLLSVTAMSGCTQLTITSLFRNCFEISDVIGSEDIVTVAYTYVNPFKFALIHNNFTKDIQKYLVENGGDGIMIFPQRWDVFSGDIIVALNSTQIQKVVIRSAGDKDSLPNYYLKDLMDSYSIRDGVINVFEPYTDFVIYNNNQIKWITENKPEIGEQVSFRYSYNPVYKVMKDMPDPRTSENNRFPRKVGLQLMAGYNPRDGF